VLSIGRGPAVPELLWEGKYGADGKKVAPMRGVVPSSVELRWRPDDHQAAFTFSS
jgi:hypothetical protein